MSIIIFFYNNCIQLNDTDTYIQKYNQKNSFGNSEPNSVKVGRALPQRENQMKKEYPNLAMKNNWAAE